MNHTIIALLVFLLSACSLADKPSEARSRGNTPYDDPRTEEWAELDRTAKAEMAKALSEFPDVKVAYLLKRFDPDGTSHFALDIVFDEEANSAALNGAREAFEKVAPADKKLEVLLLTPDLQAQVIKQAKALPFYERK